MTGLPDTVRRTRKVEIGRGETAVEVEVGELGGDAIASILDRYPSIADILVSQMAGTPMKTKVSLTDGKTAATSAIIAAGVGMAGDEAEERKAGALALRDQVKLVDAIMALTFPKGDGPWWNDLEFFGRLTGQESTAKARSSTSSRASKS